MQTMSISASVNDFDAAERRRAEARARRLTKRAETLADAGRVTEAIACQAEVAALIPDDATAFLRLGLLYREARCLEPALTAFRHAHGLNPMQHDSYEALLDTLLDAGRFDEALIEGKALAKIAPRNLFAREALCIAYLQMGHATRALEVIDEMVRIDPINPSHHLRRGMLLHQQGRLSAAIEALLRARQAAPVGSDVLADSQMILAALDDHQLRLILLLAAEDRLFDMKLHRDPPEALESRGFVLSEEGQYRLLHLLQDRDFLIEANEVDQPPAIRTYH
jgi:tetratricopeptide (TPR) repeat protein